MRSEQGFDQTCKFVADSYRLILDEFDEVRYFMPCILLFSAKLDQLVIEDCSSSPAIFVTSVSDVVYSSSAPSISCVDRK